ncbi:MAG TPA: hypothetical protein VLJ76_10895 [Gaiellaceae bacterium]|nr:hypothetical protein [Gaiellaceae bacterium]
MDAPQPQDRRPPSRQLRDVRLSARPAILTLGGQLTWVSGLVLAVSSFTSWYSGTSVEGPTLSVTGWNSGTLGKLVFLVGVGVVALAALRRFGLEFPSLAPEPLIVVALGSLGTVFVLIRLISIPASVVATSGRSVGIWISLVAALAVIAAGLLQAAEEL